MAILETREGLKAKFAGTTRWVEYTQKENRSVDFVDKKGNNYRFLSENEVHWMTGEGNRPPGVLYKISDEVQY
ncbi:MAG: hypothetical protein IPN29_06025 [Saprospiraceae bacterium]|nr:hypothetical protein [Saprospiraceae bacterium]